MLDQDTLYKLTRLVTPVKDYLGKKGLNIPFFVAGGSVFSTLIDSEWDDLDVYFYNKEDMEKACESVGNSYLFDTNNAMTLAVSDYSSEKTQFIKLKTGTPQEVIDTFDLNCSKVAFDSEYKLHHHKTFSKYIRADLKNVNNNTLNRYRKYTEFKKAEDPDSHSLRELFMYMIDNKDEELPLSYDGNPKKAIKVLKNYLYDYEYLDGFQFLHDYIIRTCDDSIDVFQYLTPLNRSYIKQASDEFLVVRLLNKIDGSYVLSFDDVIYKVKNDELDENEQRLKLKFAEYFI